MNQPKDKVKTQNFKYFTNTNCEFFPCHDLGKFKRSEEFNCLFCYCPLQYLECPGPYVVFKGVDGVIRKDCTACILPHDGFFKSWNFIQHWLKNPTAWEVTEKDVEIDYSEVK